MNKRQALIAAALVSVCAAGAATAADAPKGDKEKCYGIAKAGIGFGTALAITISWSANKSLLWAVIHGVLSWIYVVYYALVYHFK